VDVAQARTQLETVRAQLVDLGVARAQYEHAIGTIANYDLPGFSIPAVAARSPEMALPKVPLGVPSQLLERRPDIAEAERLAAAANAQIGIQISAFYPTITLGNGRLPKHQSRHVDPGTELDVDAGRAGRGAAVRRRAAPRAHRCRAPHLRSSGGRLSQHGLSGLRRRGRSARELRILEQEAQVEQGAVDAAQHSFDLSNTRYKGGVTSYLEVLTAEQTLLRTR
jgi:outer membrane protein TolC